MKNKEFIQNLKNCIKARFPLICIETKEEDRLIKDLENICKELKYRIVLSRPTNRFECDGYNKQEKERLSNLNFCELLAEFNNKISDKGEAFLFVFYGGVNINGNNDEFALTLLKNIAENIRTENTYKCNYIFIGPSFNTLPDLISSEVTILDYPLLDKEEIKSKILKILKIWEKVYAEKIQIEKTPELIDYIANASLGLTSIEIENCLAKSLVEHNGKFCKDNAKDIVKEKKQIIRKSGVLEYVDNTLSLQDVGGLEVLKRWLNLRKTTFLEDAQNFGLTPPKGVLLVGIPGCGKSLTAKCVASSWNMPLLRFDIGKVFGQWLGESEANMREALKTAEAIAPCVLWIDEIEKGLSGADNSNDDGTSKRVFGNILSWMQDKTAPVFVFATANNIKKLPPELLRKGRFDEIFFVDLPNSEERKKILEIHINKTKRNIKDFDIAKLTYLSGEENLGKNIRLAGAEIEAWIKDSLMEAYARKIGGNPKADLSMDDFITVLKRIVPMAKMRMEDFQSLRDWANENAVNASYTKKE